MELHYLEPSQWSLWDAFVASSPAGTIFQTSSYLNAYAVSARREIKVLVVYRGKNIVGGVVLLPNIRWGISYLSQPYLIPYNGIITGDFEETSFFYKRIKTHEKILELLLTHLEKKWKICSLHQISPLEDLRIFIRRSWQFEPHYTVCIKLKDVVENPEKHIAKDQRRRIRNYEMKENQLVNVVSTEHFYQMVHASYASHGVEMPVGQQFFIKFVGTLLKREIAHVFGLKIGEEILSSILIIEEYPKVYAIFSGKISTPESSASEIFLIWKVMRKYAEMGFTDFDLLGAMAPSIAKIKLELGGTLVRSDKITFFRNGLYRNLFQAFETVKRKQRIIRH